MKKVIAKVRKKNGLSQADFAKLLGVGEASVKRWEQGRGQPSPRSVRAIRKFIEDRISSDTAIEETADKVIEDLLK